MSFPEIQTKSAVVGVSLDGDVATFTYDGQPSLTIQVGTDTQLLLRLQLDQTSGSNFVTNPCDWFDGDTPVPTPSSFVVQRSTDTLCTILDFNSPSSQNAETFHFTISVEISGKVYTSPDPTIINHKPE